MLSDREAGKAARSLFFSKSGIDFYEWFLVQTRQVGPIVSEPDRVLYNFGQHIQRLMGITALSNLDHLVEAFKTIPLPPERKQGEEDGNRA